MITQSLDAFEQRSLLCEQDNCGLERIKIRKQPTLRCPKCKIEWSEALIRSGRAKGLKIRTSEG